VLVSSLPALRRYFHPVCAAADVTTQPQRIVLFGDAIVLWRTDDRAPLSVARDVCPHRGARLSQGWLVDSGCIACPYHGWEFDGAGRCTRIPQNEPDLPIPPRAQLSMVVAEERYGFVWVCVDEPVAPVPEWPHADDYDLRIEFVEQWDASAPRIVDNSLDISHVAFVHRGTIGDPDFPRLPTFDVEHHEHGLRFHLTYVSKVPDAQRTNIGMDASHAERSTFVDLVQPLCFTAVLRYANGVEHVLYKGATPIDDRCSIFWQAVARNDAPDDERWASIIAMDRAVTNEDRPVLEGIDPDFPMSVTGELHTRSDRMTVEYRRLLARLAS
jgi:phenylpropionate dioxygenase-like ring-hydroxylating dioxygenase large terminal subunit